MRSVVVIKVACGNVEGCSIGYEGWNSATHDVSDILSEIAKLYWDPKFGLLKVNANSSAILASIVPK